MHQRRYTEEDILEAITELGRWEDRYRRIKDEIKRSDGEDELLDKDMKLIREHLQYYSTLTREMKEEVNPPRWYSFLV